MRSSAPVQELGQPRLILDDRPVDDPVHLDRGAPVRRVLLQHHALATVPRRVLEGPRAHGSERVVLAVLLHGRGADDGRRARGEDGEEGRAGLFEDELDGRGVDDLHRLHVAEEVVRERVLPQLVGRMLRVDLPLDRELHRLRIERRAVVERDALAQLERVPETVLGHRPRLRQPRHHLGALVREHHKRLDDAPPHPVGVEVRHLRRIEVHGLGDEADDEGARGLSGGRHLEAAERDDHRQHQQECSLRLHETPPPDRLGSTTRPT